MTTPLVNGSEPAAVRAAFARLVAIAARGLPRMLVDDGRVLCFRARRRGEAALDLEGASERYTAMTLIGIERWQRHGTPPALDVKQLFARLAAWTAPSPGDLGLVLWAQLLHGDTRAEATVRALLQRRDEVFDARFNFPSMEMGFLLRGLAAARAAGLVEVASLADDVAERLLANQDPGSGLFAFARRVRRKNFLRARRDTRLGSFASQVYPTLALAALAEAGGDMRCLAAAEVCAEAIAERQGSQGQWWWIYHTARNAPALRYPVYSVHQDAMGPMMLLAVAQATAQPRRFDDAVRRSLAWFDGRPECTDQPILDEAGGMIWRAVQRDPPETTGDLGLGAGELARLGRAAWLGARDRRPFPRGFVCPECRPYHLGWVLLAAAMWQEAATGTD